MTTATLPGLVKIDGQSYFPKTRRHNLRLSRQGADFDDIDALRRRYVPGDVMVDSRHHWHVEETDTYYVYFSWRDPEPDEPKVEHWDLPGD